MSADTPHLDQQHRKRPVLLTWLCVLSFLFCGIQFASGVLHAFTSFPEWMLNTTKAEFERKKEEMGPEALAANRWYATTQEANIEGQKRNLASARPRGYLSIGGSCISLLAVWLMWNLRKAGFGLYTVASAGGWSGTFLLVGGDNAIISVNMILVGVVGLVFLVLYALHLKHMR